MKKLLSSLLAASLVLPSLDAALAQSSTTYQLTDSASAVHQVRAFTCLSTELCLAHVPVDSSGAIFGVTANPFFVSPASGATFPVSGTFWPYALGQQLAASSVPVVLTAAQLSTLTPPAAITNYANETGGNLAQVVTDLGAPGATACASDTASCSQNQQLQRLAQRLTSIVTAIGTPFQAGGSIGNASFGISGTLPAFAATPTVNLGTLNGAATAAKQPALGTAGAPSTDVVTVQGAASMTALKTDGSAVTQPVSAASLPLPALAATSTKQSDGTQKTQVVDGSGNVQPSGDVAARAIFEKVTDGNNTAAVKAASTAPIATDPALVVTLSPNGAVPAGENHAAEVGGNIIPITNAITTSNATATTGQSIGGLQTLAGAVRVSGSLGAGGTSAILQSVMLSFTDAVTTPNSADIYFFNASPSGSTCTNATAFVLAAADRAKVVGIAHMTDFTAGNTAVIGQALNLAMPYGLASATSLFACVVARGSFAISGTANASLMVNTLRN